LLLTGASTAATEGEQISLKLIADYKGVIEDDDAHIVNATNATTSIQFGNENTLDYLKGTQRVSLRYGLGASYETLSFLGGTSMDRVIDEALKACGKFLPKPTLTEPQAPPRVGKDCSGIPKEQGTLDCAPQSIYPPAAIASPSWASRPDVSPEAIASVLANARLEIAYGTPRWQVIAHLTQLGLDPADLDKPVWTRTGAAP
jgi:hypothetical protein